MEIGTAHPQKDTRRPIMLPTLTESQYLLDRYHTTEALMHPCSPQHCSQQLSSSYPKTEAWTKELWFVDTMEVFLAIRKNHVILFAGKMSSTRDQRTEHASPHRACDLLRMELGASIRGKHSVYCAVSPTLWYFLADMVLLPFFLPCVISLDGREWVLVFDSFLLPPAEGFCALIFIEMGFKNTLTYENMRKKTQYRAE